MARNTALESAIGNVLGQQMPLLYSIDLEFISNSVGSTYSFVPFAIDQLHVDMDYAGNTLSGWVVNLKVSGKDYAWLQDQSQNILASLKITPRASDGSRIKTVAPFLEQFQVMLINPVDVRISTQDIHLHTEPTRNMAVRLVDPLAYRLRHESVSGCLNSATVKDMLHYLVHAHEIAQTDIIDPDNVHKWDQMVLPSYPSFASAIPYLQNRYGVYGKGCNFYVHDKRLYVYPPFETSPDSQGSLTFYQSRTGQASMGGSKYCKSGDDYQIVIDTPAQTTDLSLAGAENHGTGISFTRSTRGVDGMSYIDPTTGGAFTDANTIIATTNTPQTLDPTANKIKHIRSTSNIYPHLSLLAAHNASLMTADWDGADINAFTPGRKVTYCYDENGVMSKRSGILEHATCLYTRQQRAGNTMIFSCHASMVLRMETSKRRVI